MNKLYLILIIFSIVWVLEILYLVRKSKLSIKYSLIWLTMAMLLFIVGLFPNFISKVAGFFGFMTTHFVIGIIFTLLLILTLALTMIVTNQKTQINNLVQEISILKSKKK